LAVKHKFDCVGDFVDFYIFKLIFINALTGFNGKLKIMQILTIKD